MTRPRCAPAVLLVALVCLIASGARAQSQSSSSDEEARGLYSAGTAAFSAGRYEEALGYFQHAYDLSHRAAMLYNIGQAADRSRHDEAALDAFERYLSGVTEISNRAEIEGRVRVLRAAILERRTEAAAAEERRRADAERARSDALRSVTPPVTETTRAPVVLSSPTVRDAPGEPAADIDPGAVVLVAAGGVGVVGGAIMLAVGAPDIDGPREGEIYATAVARQERGGVLVGVGGGALGLGVIAAVVGTVMLVTSSTDDRAAVTVTRDGFSVAF